MNIRITRLGAAFARGRARFGRAAPAILVAAVTPALDSCSALQGFKIGFPTAAKLHHGEVVARKVCSACHSVGEAHGAPVSKAPTFLAISKKYSRRGLERELDAIAEVGHFAMPAIRLTTEDRANLVAYIASLRAKS